MSVNINNQISPATSFRADSASAAPLAKPIGTLQKKIEGSVDTIIKTVDKDSDSRQLRNAIAVSSSILVVSALVALLNPRFSPKIIQKLTNLSEKAKNKAKKDGNNTLIKNFYKSCKSISINGVKTIKFINNINSGKDAAFKWLCTEEKDFFNIRNKSTRKTCKKIDSGVRKVLTKPYNAITNLFDNIGKHTVLMKYNKASKKMNTLDSLINSYKNKLPDSQKKEFEEKIAEIGKAREYFSKENTSERFIKQEKLMSQLEHDFWIKYRNYRHGFVNKWQDKQEHIDKNLSFWAEDILQPQKQKIGEQGEKAIVKLIGNKAEKKGAYNEAIELLAPHITPEEKEKLVKHLNKASKSLKNANYSECIEYFDKKRDLVLGSAPTDILSAIIGLGLSGIALSTADNKDEQISKLLNGVFPIVGGLAASMIFTAMLISGPIGMLAGAGVGFVLNRIGSFVNKQILGNKTETEVLNA